MTNDEILMTKEILNPNSKWETRAADNIIQSFELRHSEFAFWTAAGIPQAREPRRSRLPGSLLREGDSFARRDFPKRCRRCALPPQSKTLARPTTPASP